MSTPKIGDTVAYASRGATGGRTGQVIELDERRVKIHWTRKANGQPMSQKNWTSSGDLMVIKENKATIFFVAVGCLEHQSLPSFFFFNKDMAIGCAHGLAPETFTELAIEVWEMEEGVELVTTVSKPILSINGTRQFGRRLP